jgi:RimJ/RimL family protein N-acetyltransferase
MFPLRTVNLTISLCSPDDCADFIALEHDADVMRFLSGGHGGDDLGDTFLKPRGTEPYVWTARRTATGAFVGWFCLWPENEQVAELGYRLRRAEWGQSLASEGAYALVKWGFSSAGYDKIFASTMAANLASRRVLEKVGLAHVRTVAVDWADAIPGGHMGEVHYEATRLNWPPPHGMP